MKKWLIDKIRIFDPNFLTPENSELLKEHEALVAETLTKLGVIAFTTLTQSLAEIDSQIRKNVRKRQAPTSK